MSTETRTELENAYGIADALVKRTLDADVTAYELRGAALHDDELEMMVEHVNELTNEAKFAAVDLRAAIRQMIDG